MTLDQLKSQMTMLRNQRAQVQARAAGALHERAAAYRELIAMDLSIADMQKIAADLTAQMAETDRQIVEIESAAPAGDKPMRPLGPRGAIVEVHPTMAHIYDAVCTVGVYTVPRALNQGNENIVRRFCADLVDLGIATWKDNRTLVPQSLAALQKRV